MDLFEGLILEYRAKYFGKSLGISLKCFEGDNLRKESSGSSVNGTLLTPVKGTRRIVTAPVRVAHVQQISFQFFEELAWKPVFLNFVDTIQVYYYSVDEDKVDYATSANPAGKKEKKLFKFVVPETDVLTDVDVLKLLDEISGQFIPQFDVYVDFEAVFMPFATLGTIYAEFFVDKSDNKVDVKMYSMNRDLASFNGLVYTENTVFEVVLAAINSMFKNPPIGVGLDDSLMRIGLDSLKMSTLEFKLRDIFDLSDVPHGICFKMKTIRQLIGFLKTQKLKKIGPEMNGIGVKIKKVDLTASVALPISRAQQQLLFLVKLDPEANNLVEEFIIRPLDSEFFDVEKLKKSIIILVKKLPHLLSIFGVNSADINFTDMNSIIFDSSQESSYSTYQFDVFKKVNLAFFVSRTKVLMKFHHILIDGKSIGIFIDYLFSIYSSQDPELCEIPVDLNYFDFAAFEARFFDQFSTIQKNFKYWTDKLHKINNFQQIPYLFSEKKRKKSGKIFSKILDADLVKLLKSFSARKSVSLFSIFAAAFHLLIYKIYGISEFLTLTSVDNRLDARFDQTVGLFVNLAVVSATVSSDEKIDSFVKTMASEVIETISNSTMPYSDVVSHLRKSLGAEPKMPEVMLVQDQVAVKNGFEVAQPDVKKYVQMDQIWYFREYFDGENPEKDQKMELLVEIREGLIPDAVVDNLMDRLILLLQKMIKNDQEIIKNVNLLTDFEEKLFFERRRELTGPVRNVTPIDLVLERLKSAPDKIFLKSSREKLIGREIEQQIDQVAAAVREIYTKNFGKMPKCDHPVAVLCHRTPKMIITVLALWRLNLVPVMISVDWPVDRIRQGLADFKNLLLISTRDDVTLDTLNFPSDTVKVINLEELFTATPLSTKNPSISPKSPPKRVNLQDLAYFTFTSGSTGKPKAVQSLQIGLINIAQNYGAFFKIDSNSTVYQVVNTGFDIFFADLISAFGNGASLYLAQDKIPKVEELRYCTHAYIMAAYMSRINFEDSEFLEVLKKLKVILYGGEVVSREFLKKAAVMGLNNICQEFGITENAVYSNCCWPKSERYQRIIGPDFVNYHSYAVDVDGCLLPPVDLGANGWFRTSGVGVARGYFGDSVPDEKKAAFSAENWENGWRCFDSGDRVRYVDNFEEFRRPQTADSKNPWNQVFLEFNGRSDSQVKIRGNRVEIKDVEESVLKLPGIRENLVIFHPKKQRLICFVVFDKNHVPDGPDAIRSKFMDILPAFMVPDEFIVLPQFHLNSNGKIDRQLLQLQYIVDDGDGENSFEDTVVLEDETTSKREKTSKIVQIFERYLDGQKITVADDLFKKGADSLKLMMAVQDVERNLGVIIDLNLLFKHRKLEAVLGEIEFIEQIKDDKHLKKLLSNDGRYPLSAEQKHLWFLTKFDDSGDSNDSYLLKFRIDLEIPLTVDEWKEMFVFLVEKHVILRSQILEVDDLPFQKILEVIEVIQKTVHFVDFNADNEEILKKLAIDVLKEPSFKVFVDSTDLKQAFLAFHHIAVDGFSFHLLAQDMANFIKNPKLGNQATVLADFKYFEFIRDQKLDGFKSEIEFFENNLKTINFSTKTDFLRGDLQSFEAGYFVDEFILAGDDLESFLAALGGTTTHLMTLAFFLSQFEDEKCQSFTLGMPFANRRPQFSDTVGYFVNSHALEAARPSTNALVFDFAQSVKATVMETSKNSSVPFEHVVKMLKPKREKNKSPFFQVMLIFEDIRGETDCFKDVLKMTELDPKTAKLEQTWRVQRISDDKFRIKIEYVKDLYSTQTIETASKNFKKVLQNLVKAPTTQKIVHFLEKIRPTVHSKDTVATKIKKIWIDLLGLQNDPEGEDADMNFFDVGGHSLLAARVASTVRSALDLECPIKLIFENQTLRAFTDAVLDLNKAKIHFNFDESTSTVTHVEHSGTFYASKLQIPMLELLKNAEENGNFTVIEAYFNIIEVKCRILDSAKILDAINKLVKRHPALRTVFFYEKNHDNSGTTVYFQKIIPESDVKLKYSQEDGLQHVLSIFERLQIFAFFKKNSESTSEGILRLKISHLVTDGQSMSIIFKDLLNFFKGQKLPELTADYITFTKSINNEITNDDVTFWRHLLDHPSTTTTLEHDMEAADVNDKTAGYCTQVFEDGNKVISHLVKLTKCSPLALYIYNVAFRLRERQRNFDGILRIAFPKDLRASEGHFDVVGLFVNTLIIPVKNGDTVTDIDQKLTEMDKHSTTTLNDVISLLPNDSTSNLFDVMVVCDNSPSDSEATNKKNDKNFEILESMQKATKYALTVFFQTSKNDLRIHAEFQKSIWRQDTVESLISTIIRDKLSPTTIITVPDKPEELLTQFFDERDLSVIILEKCDQYSTQIAFKNEVDSLTYSELKRRLLDLSTVIQLSFFQRTGILLKADTVIPVVAKKSINQWLVCLSVIMSGAAYLPLDEINPDSRILDIIGQVNSQFVITTRPIKGLDARKCANLIDLTCQRRESEELIRKITVEEKGSANLLDVLAESLTIPSSSKISSKRLPTASSMDLSTTPSKHPSTFFSKTSPTTSSKHSPTHSTPPSRRPSTVSPQIPPKNQSEFKRAMSVDVSSLQKHPVRTASITERTIKHKISPPVLSRFGSFIVQTPTIDGIFKARAASCHLAYVIFTSGTTGAPKGVAINRLGVSNMIQDAQEFFQIDSESVVYQFTNFCFDNSVLEVFAALGSGATVFCPEETFAVDTFCQQIDEYGITHAMLFPGLVETFNDEELFKLRKLKAWICGAEKLSSNLFSRVNKIGLRVIQNYGPTETTAYCLRKKMGPFDDPQNLGHSVQNAKVTVRRPDGLQCMTGSKGELYVASVGLTRGYVSRKLEEQPFVVFEDGLTYYPTGDVVQQLETGEIRFVGRKDNQVKIRGFRIEMDEIESVMMTHPDVTLAKVLLTEDGQDLRVYYTNKTGVGPELNSLKYSLQKKLPYYMIPRWFTFLKEFPLTPNNKIDVQKLKNIKPTAAGNVKKSAAGAQGLKTPEIFVTMTSNTTPKNEKLYFPVLEKIWKAILKLEGHELDKNDDFFYFGGNSLSAQQLISTVNKQVTVDVKMAEFYANPTFGGLVDRVLRFKQSSPDADKKAINPTVPSSLKIDSFPLSFQQEQMLYLEEQDPESAYNLVFIQPFNEAFDPELFKKAVWILLQRQAILRTKFADGTADCEIHQQVVPMNEVKFDLKVEPVDVETSEDLTEFKKRIKTLKNKKFDLFGEIPVRCTVFKVTGGFVAVIVMHHCASDATSTQIIERELAVIYTQLLQAVDPGTDGQDHSILPPFLSYADYSKTQKSAASIKKCDRLMAEFVTDDISKDFVEKPVDLRRFFNSQGATKSFSQKCRSWTFQLTQKTGTKHTIFTSIVAAVVKTLDALKNPAETTPNCLIVGAPFANRDETTMSTVGNFLNNLVFPLKISQINSLEQLESLQKKLLKVQKYGSIPYQLLSKKLRHEFGEVAAGIQIYVNCRYGLENEASLEGFGQVLDLTSTRLKEIVEKITVDDLANYPIEIDVDEMSSEAHSKKLTLKIRISESFIDGSSNESNNGSIDAFIDKLRSNFDSLLNFGNFQDPQKLDEQIIKIISTVLQSTLSEDQVKYNSFFELGGDSIAIMKLRRSLMSRFGVTLDMAKLINACTVVDIVDYVISLTSPSTSPSTGSSRNVPMLESKSSQEVLPHSPPPSTSPPMHTSTQSTTLPSTSASTLPTKNFSEIYSKVHLSTEPLSSILIFCYPLIGGSLSYSSVINQLKKTVKTDKSKIQTILALEPPEAILGLNDEVSLTTIPDLAEFHIKEISRNYHLEKFKSVVLVGASFGAALAFQMAHGLASSIDVKVVSIDGTLMTEEMPTFEQHKTQILSYIHHFVDQNSEENMVSIDVDDKDGQIKKEVQKSWALLQMAEHYVPKRARFDCLLLTVEASRGHLEEIWTQMCSALLTKVIPGTHETMMNKANSVNVAEIVFTFI